MKKSVQSATMGSIAVKCGAKLKRRLPVGFEQVQLKLATKKRS
jgi:hypothetical protein